MDAEGNPIYPIHDLREVPFEATEDEQTQLLRDFNVCSPEHAELRAEVEQAIIDQDEVKLDRLIEAAREQNVDWQDDLCRAEQALYEMTCADTIESALNDQVMGPKSDDDDSADEEEEKEDHWYELD